MILILSIADFPEIAIQEPAVLPPVQKLYRELFNSAVPVLVSQLTIPDLAEKLNCAPKTVQRHLKDLEENELIVKLPCFDQHRRPIANVYLLSCFPNIQTR